jgi:hypothetical protein
MGNSDHEIQRVDWRTEFPTHRLSCGQGSSGNTTEWASLA